VNRSPGAFVSTSTLKLGRAPNRSDFRSFDQDISSPKVAELFINSDDAPVLQKNSLASANPRKVSDNVV
jgi:hypothetical protein